MGRVNSTAHVEAVGYILSKLKVIRGVNGNPRGGTSLAPEKKFNMHGRSTIPEIMDKMIVTMHALIYILVIKHLS